VLETPPLPKPAAIMPVAAPKPTKRVIVMEITAYCPCRKCCGPDACGITASGKKISHNRGAFVAADTDVLPFHTRISIPGYRSGRFVPVIDRGGDIKGNRIDVFFPTHAEAQRFGRRIVPVTVYDD
jgi:3D (Asp-Asp-Asp) domain-containing protein